jgi:hypothetical protein
MPEGFDDGGQGEFLAEQRKKALPLGHEYVGQLGSGFADPSSPYRFGGHCVARVKHGDIGCTRECGQPREAHCGKTM